MKMKRILAAVGLSICLLFTSVGVNPDQGVAASSELSKINAQIEKLKKEMAEAEKAKKEREKELERVRNYQELGMAEVARLDSEIAATNKEIENLNKQIADIEENLRLTVEELIAAEERVESRDALMKSRIQFMYMHGFVNYLDVLLSSTSFTDFLNRLDALQAIVTQDKSILAMNIADKMLVEQNKKNIEAQLDYVASLQEQTEKLLADLEVKKQDKMVAVASWEAKEQELEHISEEDERKIMELADEQAALVKKQRALQDEEKRKKVSEYTGGQFTWPVPDSQRITSYWGTRIHPITGKKHTHSGHDIGAPSGTKIVAAASGTVVLAQWYGGFGNTVIIEHKEGLRTLYGHIKNGGIKVKVGDVVEAGEKIAEVGSTGNSTGPHLHFGVYVNGKDVDPDPYLKGKK